MQRAKPLRHAVAWLGRAAWFVLSRQYFTLITAAVLIVLAFLVLTSDSFESRDARPATSAARNVTPTTPTPRPHRPSVLFYVVNDAAQRDELIDAVHADRFAFAENNQPIDYIVYLIAGTREQEAQVIARLNFEETAARQSNVDMRVIDLRGRFD
jgi:hypothetical protein